MTTIQQVLDSKGHDVLTVRPDDTVLHALEQMASRNVGAVIVTENAAPVGIFTERDYARSVILKGRSSTTTPVRDVMSTELVCLQPEQTVDERSEEHTSELQSLMRISYAVFCLKKNKTYKYQWHHS